MLHDDYQTFNEAVAGELTEVDTSTAYDDMLDECYSLESVGGPFAHMLASRVLEEVDPIAYRCGQNDYEDSQRDDWEEIDGTYYDRREVDDLRSTWDDEQAELDAATDDDEDESDPRSKGDDDGQEYADPSDELRDRLDRD